MTVYGLLCALALALTLAAARKNTRYDVWIRLCVTAIPLALIGSRLVIELLYGDAEKGKAIAARKADLMPIPEYIKLLDSLSTAKSASPDL